MPQYKFYFIAVDGHIKGPAKAAELKDDGAALETARSLLDGRDVEVWAGTRLVAYITPNGPTPSRKPEKAEGHFGTTG